MTKLQAKSFDQYIVRVVYPSGITLEGQLIYDEELDAFFITDEDEIGVTTNPDFAFRESDVTNIEVPEDDSPIIYVRDPQEPELETA